MISIPPIFLSSFFYSEEFFRHNLDFAAEAVSTLEEINHRAQSEICSNGDRNKLSSGSVGGTKSKGGKCSGLGHELEPHDPIHLKMFLIKRMVYYRELDNRENK